MNNLHPAYEEELRVKRVFHTDFTYCTEASKCFKGRNFMTPTIIGYTKSKGRVVEVSCGRNFDGDILFGVTFRTMSGERLENDPSTCVGSYEEVKELINV